MKKLLTLTVAAIAGLYVLPMSAQDNLLSGGSIYPLGEPKTWTNGDGNTYTFNNDGRLSILIEEPANTSDFYLFPEGGYDTDDNRALGIQGFYVDMGSSQSVEHVVSSWQTACAKAYNIYLMDVEPNLSNLPSTPTLEVLEAAGDNPTFTDVLPKGSSGRYLVIEPKDATNYAWGVKIRSIQAYGSISHDLTTFTASPSFVELNVPVNMTFTFTDQLGLDIDANEVTVTVSPNATLQNGVLTVTSGDSVTLTASKDGNILTTTIYVASSPATPNVSDIFVPIFTNGKTDNNDTFVYSVEYNDRAIDNGMVTFDDNNVAWSFGNTGCVFIANSATTGAWNGNIHPEDSNYKTLELQIFASKDGEVELEFENTGGVIPATNRFIVKAGEWNQISQLLVGETFLDNMSVRFKGDNIQDILLANVYFTESKEEDKAVATSIGINVAPEVLFTGETATVESVVLDQYGNVIADAATPQISVTGNGTYSNGELTAGDNAGAINITATLDDLSASRTIAVVDPDTYCMTYTTVTTDSDLANDSKYATDGGQEPTENGGTFVIVPNNTEDQGAYDHWILANLGRPYNVELINIIWGGAYPRDYEVLVGETANDLVPIASFSNLSSATNDRVAADGQKIQYIKIATSYNNTIWGLELLDLKVYGEQSEASVPTRVELLNDLNYVSTDENITLTGNVYDQFGVVLEDEPVVFYVGGNQLEGNVYEPDALGIFTVYAQSGDLKSDEKSLYIVALKETRLDDEEYIATLDGEQIVNDNGQPVDIVKNGFTFDIDQELEIEFENPIEFGLIKLRWEAAAPSAYTVTAKYEDGNEGIILDVNDRPFVNGTDPTDRIYKGEANLGTSMTDVNANASCTMNPIKSLVIAPTAKEHGYPLWLKGLDLYGTEGNITVGVKPVIEENSIVNVYNLNGVVVRGNIQRANALENLPAGIYIINGKKVIKK